MEVQGQETPLQNDAAPQRCLIWGVPLAASFLLFLLFLGAGLEYVSETHDSVALNQTAAAAGTQIIQKDFLDSTLEAKAAYVKDLDTGQVLFELHPDSQLPLASITKVLLVLAVSDVLSANDTVAISRDAIQRGEGGGLGTGDRWKIQDLIDFTLLASSNAGAEALADAADPALHEKYSDSPELRATVWKMNQLAHDLGLTKTYFLNASGLDASATQPGSVGSSRDVATLLTYASRAAPQLFASTLRFGLTLGPLNGALTKTRNTNEALPDIPGLILGKTGYTDLAGGNLAVVFENSPGHTIVAVVLGSTREGRFTDIKKLVDATRNSLAEKR